MLPAGPAVTVPAAPSAEAEEFVRFCYARRRVGWPELYDEMCAVASRGLFRGMGSAELAEIGIGFSLFETPRLAVMVQRLVADEQLRRARARSAAIEAAAETGLVEPRPERVARPAATDDAVATVASPSQPAADLSTGSVATQAPRVDGVLVQPVPVAAVAAVEPERAFALPRLVLAASA